MLSQSPTTVRQQEEQIDGLPLQYRSKANWIDIWFLKAIYTVLVTAQSKLAIQVINLVIRRCGFRRAMLEMAKNRKKGQAADREQFEALELEVSKHTL